MKKLFAILSATVALCLVSCTKDGNGSGLLGGDSNGGLNGTTWVASGTFTEGGISFEESLTLKFQASTFTMTEVVTYQGQQYPSDPVSGTYTLSGSKVTLTAKDDETGKDVQSVGTISGNKMTFSGDDGLNGETLVFVKQ